ncbi:uncharacterized protein N7459_008118 [Penicillium hispanicum]|uniref:uncharacterized protein n=1 Tax=Penicillium hispanicum TaxID=1080232 RepID=UPI00254021CD|nr:uncharacterized protein N7459_008118 [Penicillium hispanicum]KAJ5573691.1 hypothetical protein N7459_008118 [Penicillium hispanicum]
MASAHLLGYHHRELHEDPDKSYSSFNPPQPSFANRDLRQYFERAGDPGMGPEEDWLLQPELPSKQEILGQETAAGTVLLAPNRVAGPWKSKNEYLKTHYDLVREDNVAPLRDAVAFVRECPSMMDTKDISIYEKVFISRVTLATRGMAFRLRFSTRRAGKKILWKYSSRLIAGTLVALSPVQDSFSSQCVVAVVAARPLENVTKTPPEVDIFFDRPEDREFDPQKEWIMVEARSGYYESCRHTLTALQKLSKESFPLSNHICGLNSKVEVPEYVKAKPIVNFQSLTQDPPRLNRVNTQFNVVDEFPPNPMGNLNTFQWEALKEILTKELAIIQGPPGTGKTYVSVVALKILLSEMAPGDPPIIIATQTNHALDQLIKHVSRYEPSYIRLGGRSTDVDIRKRTLYAIKNSQPPPQIKGGLMEPARREMRGLVTKILDLFKPLDRENCQEPLGSSTFAKYGLLTQQQCESLNEATPWVTCQKKKVNNPFVEWLGREVVKFEVKYDCENFGFVEGDIDLEYEQLRELEAEEGPENDEWENLRGRYMIFGTTYEGRHRNSLSEASVQRYLENADLWKIPVKVRGAVYNLLRRRLLNILQSKLRELADSYSKCCKKALIGKWERDYEILRTAKLVAMTTTGLSKYRALVSSLNPRTVLIEEAAEVIEAPVAVACFESLQRLILVGDHKQLKGHCALHDLTGDPFYLDVSMFERLVNNKMPFVMLREQRRMVPVIRELLAPIYGDLQDHSSVDKYPSVPGMGNVQSFFFTHQWSEGGDSLSSKLNELEAVMVVEFFTYLLLNGIKISRITVLTFYNGQRKLILKMMKTNPYLANHFPNVVTVDSYQGEENDIVILSLVRSTGSEGIGFLAVDNRVCVALSRAKQGLYIFGNSKFLQAKSPIWRTVVSIMSNGPGEQRLGISFPLTCQRHNTKTEIRAARPSKPIMGQLVEVDDFVTLKSPDQQVVLSVPPKGPGTQNNWGDFEGAFQSVSLSNGNPILSREKSDIISQKQWIDFANGRAREIDICLETLAKAADASSEEVQQAMLRVDDRLIPKALKQPKEPKEITKPPVPHLLDLDF